MSPCSILLLQRYSSHFRSTEGALTTPTERLSLPDAQTNRGAHISTPKVDSGRTTALVRSMHTAPSVSTVGTTAVPTLYPMATLSSACGSVRLAPPPRHERPLSRVPADASTFAFGSSAASAPCASSASSESDDGTEDAVCANAVPPAAGGAGARGRGHRGRGWGGREAEAQGENLLPHLSPTVLAEIDSCPRGGGELAAAAAAVAGGAVVAAGTGAGSEAAN
ncbi:hypothetical protein B0H15DRAFT_1020924 [Mycena belliarum]|uniref:Uncharacterized protein n=1 Tax=Mycena belliarum TaxID=1033014 RepID=A0AAD6XU47_9AGAR|nr:hypothetical protein B0H15DRAFT_1020924 [Mycena belliae]